MLHEENYAKKKTFFYALIKNRIFTNPKTMFQILVPEIAIHGQQKIKNDFL